MRYVSPLAFLIACLIAAPFAGANSNDSQPARESAAGVNSNRGPASVMDAKSSSGDASVDDQAVKKAMSRDADAVLSEMQSALEQVESVEENSGL